MPDDRPDPQTLTSNIGATNPERLTVSVGDQRRPNQRRPVSLPLGGSDRRISEESAISIQAHPTVTIETTQADPRGTQFVCNVIISNKGSVPIDIVKVVARVPPGVTLEDGVDSDTVRYNCEVRRLCNSLSELCERLQDVEPSAVKLKNNQKLSIIINGYAEAQNVYDRIVRKIKDDDEKRPDDARLPPTVVNIISIYEVKLAALKKLSEKREKSVDIGGILEVINPQSSFSRMYMFRGTRDFLTPQSYTVSFDCVYRNMLMEEAGIKVPDFTCCKSVTMTITPHPAVLSLMAVIASVGGLAVSNAVDKQSGITTLQSLVYSLFGPNLIVAAISAFIFFNAYEHTEMGKKLEVAIGWRSATFIGFITGLLNEKILTAIMALAGSS